VTTLVSEFVRTVAERADEPALRWWLDGPTEPERELTWREYADRAAAVAAGLADVGVRRGDHVVLLLRNRVEFYLADTACLLLGAISVSVYLSPDVAALARAIADSAAVACVVENDTFLARARAALSIVDKTVPLIGVDTAAPDVVPFADLTRHSGLDLAAAAAGARPGDTATMLFTSGTTGPPKGVPLTHANLVFATRTLRARMGVSLTGCRQLSYLPMAHIGERLATHYLHLAQGSVVTCCPELADFPAMLRATAPHMLFGAPRMWERLHDQITALGTDPRAALAELGLADVLVAIVGSAPLPRHVQRFWLDLGVPLADCYGQTENCGMGTWDPHDIVLGTCGKPFDGMEIGFTDDSEILVRGPAVFGGYHRNPASTATAIDADGWYHTGDLGHLDDGGNLVLRGRLTDVLVPTSGHNVAPAPLEHRLCRIPLVGHAVVVGHGRPHLAAVLALDEPAATEWAAAHDRADASIAELATDPALLAEIDAAVAAVNADLPGSERIRAHVVVTEIWQPATDVLTATGKLRRPGVTARYAVLIDTLYAS
jgi:long-subunit acyl-CoA synthetase (AMP-forming)